MSNDKQIQVLENKIARLGEKIANFEKALLNYMHDKHQDLLDEINKNPVYSDAIEQKLTDALTQFKTEYE